MSGRQSSTMLRSTPSTVPTPAMDLASRLRLHEKKIGNNR
jgi:hypothetical protein